MAEPKLTEWFSTTRPPEMDGVYQVRPRPGVIWWSLYSNGVWHATTGGGGAARAEVFGRRNGRTKCHLTAWRGLAEEPK